MNDVYLWVAFGGGLGAMARFWCAAAMTRLTGAAFPWGTLLINIAGSFAIGLFGTLSAPGGSLHGPLGVRAFVLVGICGGFTTFSSFSLQTLELVRSGNLVRAGAYILSSVVLCLIFVWFGVWSGIRL